MATADVKIEGVAQLSLCEIVCVCSKCDNTDKSKATIEFNFKEQKIFYICSKCRKQNVIQFGSNVPPLPRTQVGR